jgi:hypothetical protein
MTTMQNVTPVTAFSSVAQYGHSRMYVLRGSEGMLCHFFWAAPHQPSVVLFTDPKTAKKWVTKANKMARWDLKVDLHMVDKKPDNFTATINPADDEASINLILKKAFWQNW